MHYHQSIAIAALFVLGCATSSPPSSACMPGASWDDGACRPYESPGHRLPFRKGFEARVTQGFHGYRSHHTDQPYSVDFKCDEGEPVVASRDGVVWEIKEDSDSGCSDPACLPQENFVILDHGDGTYTLYNHLLFKGALVDPGQQVCAGQIVGLCGNTGYSDGSHLHFSLLDASRHTVPFHFDELRRDGIGIPAPGSTYRSQNEPARTCRATEYSKLGEGAFAHQGILMDDPIPLVVDTNDSYVVSGRYGGDRSTIAIHRKPMSGGAWLTECFTMERKRFEVEVRWPDERFPPGAYWLMITGSDEECGAPTWAWSYKVRVAAPVSPTPR